jgi:hypothetical protein
LAKYAETTSVSVDQSRAEIERTLVRYGADGFMYGWDGNRAVIQFRAHGRFIRFVMPLPDREDEQFTTTPERGFTRSKEAAQKAWEQATRQRWRALALAIKAKLEAVEAGIATFEEEFLSYIVLPNKQTVSEWMGPQLSEAYSTGEMPDFLPGLSQVKALGSGG